MNEKQIVEFCLKLQEFPSIDKEYLKASYMASESLKESIYSIMTSSRFRRTKTDVESIFDINSKISYSIQNRLPIEFTVPFGGYKNYRISSFPEVDWAEVFNLRYLIKYVYPITQIYKPGVHIFYTYNSKIIHTINNIPLEYQRRYESQFKILVDYFSDFCPTNLKISIQEINELYETDDEWREELAKLYERNKLNWENIYSRDIREKKINSSIHNLMLNGERNLLELSKEDLEKEYLNAAMMCDAIDSLSKRRNFNKYSSRIQLVFVRGPKPSIHIGVCEGSTMHFWVGLGIVKMKEDLVLPQVLSFSQIESLKEKLLRIDLPATFFSSIAHNFKHIYTYS